MVDVVKLQRSATRYEMADGIRDMQHALWLLVLGFYTWMIWDLPALWVPSVVDLARSQGTFFALLAVFVLAIGIPVILIQGGLRLANEYVRRRWLWRETGFITPRAWVVTRPMLFIAAAIMLLALAAGTWAAVQANDGWIIVRALYLGMGLELAYIYLVMGNQFQLVRYRLVALAGAVGTVLIALLPLSVGLAGFALTAFWAGVLVASGIYAARQVAAAQQGLSDAS